MATPAAEATLPPLLATTHPSVEPAGTTRPQANLLLDSMVYVLVDRLNFRAQPTTNSKSIGVVEEGDFLVIGTYGPFDRDGFTWYSATFLALAGEPPTSSEVDVRGSEGIRGWIAAAKGSTPFVQALRPRCPETVELRTVQHLLGSELLACFGSTTIELTGTFGCGGCGGETAGSFEPGWLIEPVNGYFLTERPVTDHVGPFAMRFPPGGPEAPPEASIIRVRGHFDDPAAASCAISIFDPYETDSQDLVALPSEASELLCSQQFVVEEVEITGTDPDFNFG